MLDRRGRALPNDYARLRWRTEPRIAFGPQRIIPAPANRAPCRTRRRLAFLHGALMFRPHHDYGVVYSTIALTWGRKPAGGFNWTDAAWSSACMKWKNLRPTSMFTLSVCIGPLPLSILTVAGIVAGAPASPKLS